MPKYTVIINGEERTIDKDKFDGNIEAISAKYPDAKIKAINGDEEGMLPVSNYLKAIEKGYRMVESKTDIPVSRFVQGKGKDTTIFGVPYSIYAQMKPESQSYYYQKALNEEREQERKQMAEQASSIKGKADEQHVSAMGDKVQADYDAVMNNPFLTINDPMMGVEMKTPEQTKSQKKVELTRAASERADDAFNMIEEAGKKGNTSFVSGFGRGFWEKVSKASTWDFGGRDMQANLAIASAAKKYESGQPLSNEEENLLDAVALEAAANGEFSGDLGRGYKAGMTTAESLPFMAEFMINPATGTGEAISKAAAKKIISNFGKEAAKSTIGKIARNSVRVAGDIAGAGIMSGTTGAMRTSADAVDRMIGDVSPIIDSDGYYRFGGTEGGEGLGKSLVKAYGASTIENFSEMFGNYLAPIGGVLGTSARKGMSKIGLGKVNKVVGDIKSSDIARVLDDFQSKTQWNGTIGEYLEEQAGMAMNALTVGDNNLSDFIDVDTQIDTFLGVSSLGGLFSGIKTFGYAKNKYSAKQKLNEADRSAANNSEIDELDWNDLKERINQADDSELVSILSETFRNDDIRDDSKQAILLYAGRLKAYHGASLADLKRKTEGDTPDEIVQSQMNFDEGYKLAEADRSEKRSALRNMNELERKLDDEFIYASDEDRYNLVRQRADAGEDVSNELAYINSQSKLDGMILGIRDAIDGKVAKSNQYITNLTHQDGNVYDVTLTVDEKKHVFPISGKIVFDENGIVDRKQSDSRFIVRDNTGKVEMRSVEDLYKLESSNNADELKDITAQSIREQESARHAEEIETPSEEEKAEEVASIQPGDVISLDMQGIKATATVQSKSDGSTILQFDEPIEYNGKKSQIIELSDEQVQSIIIPDDTNSDALTGEDVVNDEIVPDEQSNVLDDEGKQPADEIDVVPIEETAIEGIPAQEQVVDPAATETESAEENQVVSIPVDKKGNKVYHKVPVEVSLGDMRAYGLDDAETDEFVNSQKVEAAKRVEKLQKGKPKVGTNLEKYQMDKKAWTDEMADAQAQNDYWTEMEAQIQATREQPGDVAAEEIKSMGEPLNGGELAAVMLGNGKLPLLYGDYKRETGFSNTDARGMFGMFASKENGGMTIEQAGEQLMLADLENGTNFFDQNDPNAGRNAIIEVLSSARTKGDLVNYINKGREAMAERERQAEYEAYERWYDESFHMSPEDYETYEEQIIPSVGERYKDFDTDEFYGRFVEELNKEDNDTERKNRRTAESDAVLQGEEVVSSGRTGTGEDERADVQAGLQGGIEDGTTSENISGRDVEEEKTIFATPEHVEGESIFEYAERVNDAHILHEEEQKVDTNPTEAQKEAGNYKKGHIKVDGFDITIENPKGSERSGVDAAGKSWSVKMNNTYGYIRGTEGVDGDHIDIFLGDTGDGVYVVDQVKDDGSFDEHKVMYGFSSLAEAKEAYLSNYSPGWKGLGDITGVSKEIFKKWVDSSHHKTKSFAEYKSVKPVNVEKDAGHMKAPNGRPSRLDERQWIQVRSEAFKDWFGDWEHDPENASKVLDENGEPLVVYHGTSTGGFTIFNTYGSNFGLFGQGSYFTNDREVAESYTDKGKGDKKQVYGVFLNIRHPLDMNSHNIAEGWKEALPDDISVEIGEDSTNESVYKSVLESFEYNEYPKNEAQEILYDLPVSLGYDGVTHIGGGRYNDKDGTRHRVWIAMEPVQIKSATDNNGEFSGDNGDIRFRFEDGNESRYDEAIRVQNDFASRYNSGDILIIKDADTAVEQAKAVGIIDDRFLNDIKEIASDGETSAFYSPFYDRILIFAENGSGDYESSLFHENFHRAIRKLELSEEDINGLFALVYPTKKAKFDKALEVYKQLGESELAAKEECVVYSLEVGIYQGFDKFFGPIQNNEVVTKILDFIGYGKENERGRRLLRQELGADAELRDDEAPHSNEEKSGSGRTDSGRIREEDGAESERKRNEARDEISSSVKSLSSDLNTLVRIVRDVNELTDSDSDMLQHKQESKGWFDPKTGEVVFVLPNANSVEDAQATILHEVVAHKGLREMFGEEFDVFLDDVYRGGSEEIRDRINRLVHKNKFDIRVATEEYLASLAERGFEDVHERSVWEKIKKFFSDMLIRAGIKLPKSLRDEDLRYILWKSMNRLRDGDGIVEKADRIAKDREVSDRIFRFREEDTDEREEKEIAKREYEDALDKTKNRMYRWKEAYQDSMLALKKLQDAIVKESGEVLKYFEDAYMAENQMSSKSAFETEVYKDKFLRPMLDAIKAITDKKVNRDEVNAYVMAKHGLERNIVFAKRDAEQAANDEFDEKISDVNRLLDKGDISYDEWEETLDGLNIQKKDFYEEQYMMNRMRDYSGLTQLTEEEENYEEAAKEIVDQFEEAHGELCDQLWEKINLATKNTLKKSYESGLMTRSTYDKVRNMFENYVPLRGWDDKIASDVYEYMLSERSAFQAPVKAALGRESQADDPFANIGNMAESGILQGNRNLMKQKFLNMVLNHPTSLTTVKTMWYENAGSSENPKWVQSIPDISVDATADEIGNAIEAHESRMNELRKNGMATKSINGIKLDYRASTREKNEHTVVVKSGGKEYVIYINGNPRASQAINGLTNPDASDHKMMQLIGRLNRQLAANFTTRNPAFVLSNMSRDVIFSTSAIWVKEDWKYAKRFDKNIVKNIGAIAGLMARYKSGRLDMRNSRDRHFLEFLENGGETGYTALHNVNEYKKMMDRHVKKSNGTLGSVSSGMHAIVDAVSFMNRCAENVSRFTTYQTSREMGRGISESIKDAKEVTVNFNKKGAGGLGAGTFKSLFLFFNAAVQSLNNFKELHGRSKSKFYTSIGGFAAAGILMPMINNAIIGMLIGDGDDDMTDEERAEWIRKRDAYDNLPEWVRRSNFCIWTGGERFITIPLPIELRAFYGLGEMWYQMGKGNMNGIDGKVDVKKASVDMVNQLTELLPINPLGGNGDALSVIVPDAGKPLYQVFANRDFFGKPIYKKGDYNELMPAWTKAYSGTAKWMVNSAEFINEVSGGDKYRQGNVDLNPAAIEHLFEGYLGGMGKTANQLYKTISMIWDEDERMWRNVPVANRFVSGSDNKIEFRKVNEVYYQCMDELKETEQRLRGYENEAEMGIEEYAEKYDFLNDSKEYERYQVMKEYKSVIDDMRKAIKESDPEEKKEIEMEINLMKIEMIDELKDIR
jgi:hypothetical protein